MVFGESYSNQYDRLYGEKNYSSECDLIEHAFTRFASAKVSSVVDWGCGTGAHSILLAQRGYRLTGIDLSEHMLDLARRKSDENGLAVQWIRGDIRSVDPGRTFDAAVCMFAVLGYLSSNDDVLTAFRNIRSHLVEGGVLAFDIWYGPAVLAMKPADRIKVLEIPGGTLIRTVNCALDIPRQTCTVKYKSWELSDTSPARSGEDEIHRLRFFFPMELELLLSQSGFRMVSLSAFPKLDSSPDETTWNAFVVSVAE